MANTYRHRRPHRSQTLHLFRRGYGAGRRSRRQAGGLLICFDVRFPEVPHPPAESPAVFPPANVRVMVPDVDRLWAPFQILFLIVGPLLLEPLVQAHVDEPVFDESVIARRSGANLRLLSHGIFRTETED